MLKFKIKTEVRFSDNAIETLTEFSDVNAVIITDAFMVSSGVSKMIAEKLSACKTVSVFSDVKPDPTIELVSQGVEYLKEHDAEIVIGLGGGSSIDAAKLMVFLYEKVTGKKHIKLIAIPTTSGTGSEVTQFAVVTDTEAGIKYPLVDDKLIPDMAILDPQLVVSAPPSVTADTGMDVITHALEAYLSTRWNDAADALAEKALTIAFKYLPIAYKDGANIKAREKMHSASCLAGMSFNEVGLGINHSIAHALGAKFHIPHGRANAMLLPHVMEFNADLAHNFGASEDTRAARRIARIARRIYLPSENTKVAVTSFIEELKYMQKMMKIPTTLAEAKVSRDEYEAVKEEIIESALKDACTETNPRPVTAKDIEKILSKIAVW
ncbi:MAG: iron-containing alcohol dehydrogenase [Clostridia bacterium]|nr:iron-containing alcohol dehydrogenase [Clostridia bacterium]MBQ3553703.1 iron-containing alcohol dehydrogenase [Clostridia bacterium]